MSVFKENFLVLCKKADKLPQIAFYEATGKVKSHLMARLENGWTPDGDDVVQLAEYFGVGVTDLTESEPIGLCYLAGPITGVPDFLNRHKWAKAYLESAGEHVCSPALITDTMPKAYMNRKQFLDLGFAVLSMCGAIALMPGWEDSAGCVVEHGYAETNGYRIIYLTEEKLETGRKLLIGGLL